MNYGLWNVGSKVGGISTSLGRCDMLVVTRKIQIRKDTCHETERACNKDNTSAQGAVGVAGPLRFLGVVSGIPLQVLGVLNEDFTVNSMSNAAQAGSVITLYVSGAGQTVPAMPIAPRPAAAAAARGMLPVYGAGGK